MPEPAVDQPVPVGTAPSPPQGLRRTWLVATGVLVILAGFAGFAGGRLLVAPATSPAHEITGRVTFDARTDALGPILMTENCPSFGPTGAKITVTGEAGTILGIGVLGNGRPDIGRGGRDGQVGMPVCVFDFAIADVPDAAFYTFDGPLAGPQSGRTFALDELAAVDWAVAFNGP